MYVFVIAVRRRTDRFRRVLLLALCVGCGIIIRASAEELAAEPQGRRGVALLINMLHHAQLMHSAEYGQLLSLFDKLAQECAR